MMNCMCRFFRLLLYNQFADFIINRFRDSREIHVCKGQNKKTFLGPAMDNGYNHDFVVEITSCVEWTEVYKNVKLLTILSYLVLMLVFGKGALVHMAWRMCNTTLIRPNIMTSCLIMCWSWSAAMQPHIQQTAIHSVF